MAGGGGVLHATTATVRLSESIILRSDVVSPNSVEDICIKAYLSIRLGSNSHWPTTQASSEMSASDETEHS